MSLNPTKTEPQEIPGFCPGHNPYLDNIIPLFNDQRTTRISATNRDVSCQRTRANIGDITYYWPVEKDPFIHRVPTILKGHKKSTKTFKGYFFREKTFFKIYKKIKWLELLPELVIKGTVTSCRILVGTCRIKALTLPQPETVEEPV